MKKIILGAMLAGSLAFSIEISAKTEETKPPASLQESDLKAAFEETLKKAEAKDIKAEADLGEMYYKGNGVTQDYEKAFKWFKKAGKKGDLKSLFYRGYMYHFGQGVSRNNKKAAKWFTKAAKQGHLPSQLMLGGLYHYSTEGMKNDEEALKWYMRAAEQGEKTIQFLLAEMYLKGDGVPMDLISAYMWTSIATARVNPSDKTIIEVMPAVFRKEFSGKLTPEQIYQAKSLAEAWLQKHKASFIDIDQR